MQDGRVQEEQVTARRASVLGLGYVDTSKIQKQLFRNVLSVQELRQQKIVPLSADEHNIHFGITTTTSQQTITKTRGRFTDQRLNFSIISETGFKEYMLLYDPPKKVEYEDISINKDTSAGKDDIVEHVSQTLEQVRPDDMLAYLVQQAYELKASDIHLECQKDNVRVRFRVDGVLHPVAYISHEKYRHLAPFGKIQRRTMTGARVDGNCVRHLRCIGISIQVARHSDSYSDPATCRAGHGSISCC